MNKYQFMLSKLGDRDILNRKSLVGFIFEPFFDGTRVLIYKEGNDIEIINALGNDIIFKYPELLDIPRYIKTESCVLDAELVVLGEESIPDAKLLQEREQLNNKIAIDSKSKTLPAKVFVFDILEKDGEVLTEKFLGDRKRILEGLITSSFIISFLPHLTKGKDLWKQVQEQKIEGIMAKEINSRYQQGKKSWSWLKIKNLNTANAIIVGFTKKLEEKQEKYFESAILASCVPEKMGFVYVGKLKDIETNFNKRMLKKLTKRMKKLVIERSCLNEGEKNKIDDKNIIWIKPEIVIQLSYSELTKEKQLRGVSFLRLRFDMKPANCFLLS